MNKWKVAFWIALVVLIASNVFWLFITVDTAVSTKYREMTIDEQDRVITAMGDLIVKGAAAYSQADILHLLRQADPEGFIVEKDSFIVYEGVMFQFEQDSLVAVYQEAP